MRTKIYYAGDKPSIQEVATVIAQEFKLPAEQLQPAYGRTCAAGRRPFHWGWR